MGIIECSQPASKSSWDSQDFGDISMVLKMAHFRKSTGPRWVNPCFVQILAGLVSNVYIERTTTRPCDNHHQYFFVKYHTVFYSKCPS